jgi:CRISPR-associated protein Cmr6
MLACNKRPQPNNWTKDWRESWHPSNVQVWGRLANDAEDSVAVRWFHAPYQPREKGLNKEGAICKSSLTGKINQIGRIWHRMYPVILLKNNPEDPRKAIVRPTLTYLEILTIFSDNSDKAQDFLKFLETNPGEFQQLWGDSQL